MTRHSANHMRFDPRPRTSFRRFNADDDSVRVLLVAIHHALQPAAFLGSHPLQRLQVLLAAPGEEVDLEPLNAIARATAGAARRLLPQLPAASAAGARPRLVQGEILSDDDGRLYEKVGRRIRPLQRLFSGPRGEVLELPTDARAEARAESQAEARVEAQAEQRAPSPQAPDADASNNEAQAKTRSEAPPQRPQAPPQRPQAPQRPFRRLPQRPREAFRAQHSGGRGVIRGPIPHSGGAPNAGRQSVPPEGGAPNVAPNAGRQSVRPEGGAPNASRQPVPPEGATPNVAPNAGRQSRPEGGAQNASARCLKTMIPEQWIKPWEFQISREEALYDMRAAASSRNAPLAFIRDLTNRFAHGQAWRKWQALLAGKSLDEQLWAVRPPRGTIARAAVRDWARQTLEQAGYDTRVMLAEWEIFWRRKGL